MIQRGTSEVMLEQGGFRKLEKKPILMGSLPLHLSHNP